MDLLDGVSFGLLFVLVAVAGAEFRRGIFFSELLLCVIVAMIAVISMLTVLAGFQSEFLGLENVLLFTFEDFDFIFVVSDLDFRIIDDDGSFQDRWILLDEKKKFLQGHLIDIDILLLEDLASRGDDFIGSV